MKRMFRMILVVALLTVAGLGGASSAEANSIVIGPTTPYTTPSTGASIAIVDPCINKGWYRYGAYRVYGANCAVYGDWWHLARYSYWDQWGRAWTLDCWSTPVQFLYCEWR